MSYRGWSPQNNQGTRELSQEEECPGVRSVDYPPTPLLLPILLPPEDQLSGPIVPDRNHNADGQWTPLVDALVCHNDTQGVQMIDHRLAFRDWQRPVAEPEITGIWDHPNYLFWGAGASPDQHSLTYATDWGYSPMARINFQDIPEPATWPPVFRMTIITDSGHTLSVVPQVVNQCVTVGDVQRAVINWMRTNPGGISTLARRIRVRGQNTMEIEINVWVWRGLVRIGAGMGLWALEF